MSLFLHFQVYLGYNELVRNAFLLKIAFLAQLVEQWTLNPWVAGSSPAGGIHKVRAIEFKTSKKQLCLLI